MAKLGVRTVDELVGRTDLLTRSQAATLEGSARRSGPFGRSCRIPCVDERRDVHFTAAGCLRLPAGADAGHAGADEEARRAALRPSAGARQHVYAELSCATPNRAFGTILGREITSHRSATACRKTPSPVDCHGTGGQSFRRVHPPGPDPGAGRRRQRLPRQGPVRRQARSSIRRRSRTFDRQREHRHRQRGRSTAPPAARRSSAAWRASASACATPARLPSWRAWATTAAST